MWKLRLNAEIITSGLTEQISDILSTLSFLSKPRTQLSVPNRIGLFLHPHARALRLPLRCRITFRFVSIATSFLSLAGDALSQLVMRVSRGVVGLFLKHSSVFFFLPYFTAGFCHFGTLDGDLLSYPFSDLYVYSILASLTDALSLYIYIYIL